MKKIFNNKYFLLLISQVVIVFSSFINTFPKGYMFSGGDVTQYLNYSPLINNLKYIWNSLQDSGFRLNYGYDLFYFPFLTITSFFNLSSSSQSFLYFYIFLFSSFWGFYFGLKAYKPSINYQYHIFFSFLYAFNIYTFSAFYGIWGYSPFLYLYPLIPLFFGLTYSFFVKKINIDHKILSFLGMVFFLSNIANGNLPFFVSINILIFLFLLFIFVFDNAINKLTFLKKTFLYYFVYFLSIFWSVIPQVHEMLKIVRSLEINESSFFDMGGWIIWQATKFPDVFFINPSVEFYRNNFSLMSSFSFLFFFVLILTIANRKKNINILYLNYLFLLFFTIFLLNKGVGFLSNGVILAIFQKNFILASLRSVDKTIIFLPFFVLVLIFLNFENLSQKIKSFLSFLLVLSLFSVFPFFIGDIQTKYSNAFNNKETFLTTQYSYLHKIPDEYYMLANNLNIKKDDIKILRTPYNVINSIGWVNFPKWKQVGIDPTIQLLFNKSTLQMNSPGTLGAWNYGAIWNQQKNNESLWLLPFAGLHNIKYFIYQKDVDPMFIKQTRSKITFYEINRLLRKLYTNDYFDTYEINNEYFLPHFYTPRSIIISSGSLNTIPSILSKPNYQIRSAIYLENQNTTTKFLLDKFNNFNKVKENIKSPVLEFNKINPIKYRVVVHGAKDLIPLIFSENFHDGWKIYLSNMDDNKFINLRNQYISNKIQDTIQNDNLDQGTFYETWFKNPINDNDHFVANGFANGWLIDTNSICLKTNYCKINQEGSYDFEIIVEFWPQRLFYIGLAISGSTLLVCISYLIYGYSKRKKHASLLQQPPPLIKCLG